MPRKNFMKWNLTLATAILLTTLLTLVGCTGAVGPAGPAGPAGAAGAAGANGVSTGTFSGKVTNSVTSDALSGVTVTITGDSSIPAVKATTANDGTYTASLPVGTYSAAFAITNFTSVTQTVTILGAQTSTRDVALKPTANVIVSAGTAAEADPGSTVSLSATATTLDNSTITAYQWTQTAGVAAKISDPTAACITVTMAAAKDYKTALLGGLELIDRWMVQPINPHALALAKDATFKVTVTTSSGKYSGTVTVSAKIPYEVSTGLEVVPVSVPVLLHGKSSAVYDWKLVGPTGTKAVLDNKRDQNPSFTPDVVGKYTLSESTSGTTLVIYGGTWTGAISGLDATGKLLSANCTICHNGKTAPDQFTAWAATGHAAIFSDNLNTSTHYGEACLSCHTVGYDPAAVNGGMDDAPDYVAFVATGMLHKAAPANWTNTVANYPKSAQLANIQCENCHGPDNNTIHPNTKVNPERISLSAALCGSCHGEPLRHGRFQQWAESAHGNYETAMAEGTRASCTRCHSAQGFMLWQQQGGTLKDLTKAIQGAAGDATTAELAAMGITSDTVDPITCAVCHDPHDVGTTTGLTTDAQPRITGDTLMLPSGFMATNVGKGAMCITCHNTRNGAHNDSIVKTAFDVGHSAAQGDVLMGQNSYFVGVSRSPHADIKDTCVTCHMELSPAPAAYSLPGNGTNHGFTASIDICKDCHSESLSGEALQAGVEAKIAQLKVVMGTYLLGKLPDTVTVTDAGTAGHTYNNKTYNVASAAATIQKSNVASITWEYFGRNMPVTINLKTPVAFTYTPTGETAHTVSVSTIVVTLANIKNGTTQVIAFSDNLSKAGWNLELIEADSSLGVHNPGWVNDVLDATITALK